VPDSLAPEVVEPLLRGRFGRPYRYAEVTPSTQRLLRPDDPEGAVAVAEEQTEGRGRLGRSWHAPARTSVLVSVVLEPAVLTSRLPELSLVAGDAIAGAIVAETGLAPSIKHPNDVLVGGRKVAGILAESSEGRVVLGIGVNAKPGRGRAARGDTDAAYLVAARNGERGGACAAAGGDPVRARARLRRVGH
jgi:BirA family transcriptional regulator, biotin operon repressor / biotin---[acetyl-CoA-carboxylase] ligase